MVFSVNQDWAAYCDERRRGRTIRWSEHEQRRHDDRPEPNAVEIVFVSRRPGCTTTSSSSSGTTPAQRSEPHHCHDDYVKDEEDDDDCAYSDATSVSSVTLASTFDEDEDDDEEDIVTLVENGMINNNKRGGFFASLTLEEEEEETTMMMMTPPPPPRQPQHLLVSDTDVPLWFSSSNHDASPSMMIVWNLNSSDHSLADVDNNDVDNNDIINSKDHRPTTTGAARIRQQLLQSSSPVVARIWIRRGDAYAAKHWYRQAQLAYQHAIDVLTDNDIEDGSALAQEAYAGLGRVHQALGDRNLAEKYRVFANDDAMRRAATTATAMTTGGGSPRSRLRSLANDDALSDLFRQATTID
jgi:hypothetical protein